MTITLDFSPAEEAALRAQAEAHSMSVEAWLSTLIRQQQPLLSAAHLQKTDPDEWARQFHAWAESHDRTTPLLSEEAVSRESIYPDWS